MPSYATFSPSQNGNVWEICSWVYNEDVDVFAACENVVKTWFGGGNYFEKSRSWVVKLVFTPRF